MKPFLKYDWNAIAGIIAAMAAIFMHMLHLVEAEGLLMITVVPIALLFFRDLRRERMAERIGESLHQTELSVTGRKPGTCRRYWVSPRCSVLPSDCLFRSVLPR